MFKKAPAWATPIFVAFSQTFTNTETNPFFFYTTR